MTALLVPDGVQSIALDTWERAAQQIGRRPDDVVHWVHVKNIGQRKHLASAIASVPDVQTISVVLCKFHLPNVSALKDPGYLYNWTLRFVVERLSWFGQQHGDQVAMTFAQVKGLEPATLTGYLDLLEHKETFIQWDHVKVPPRIDTPANRRMLQLADSASGAVYAAFERDQWGYTEQGYLELLKPVLWRRPGRPLWKDGLKYGPWPSEDCSQEHPWFEGFCG
jgi:hypothetical protein